MERRRTFSRVFKIEAVKQVTERGVAVAQEAPFSMSRAGEVWDNSAMKSFFSSLRRVPPRRVLLQPATPAFDARLCQPRGVCACARSLDRRQQNRQRPNSPRTGEIHRSEASGFEMVAADRIKPAVNNFCAPGVWRHWSPTARDKREPWPREARHFASAAKANADTTTARRVSTWRPRRRS